MELAVCSRLLGDSSALESILNQQRKQQEGVDLAGQPEAAAALDIAQTAQQMQVDQSRSSSSSTSSASGETGFEQAGVLSAEEGAVDAAVASWLRRQVLARFPESRGEEVDLAHWFGSADVTLYLKVKGGGGSANKTPCNCHDKKLCNHC
jgi:uncharacterized membrane protein